jgi:nucleotide-binding universal stress UspA family protein
MEDSVNYETDNFIPQRLLLATDLCLRCDRPLERAKQLAREWQASVTVLMVRDGPGTPEEVASWLDGRNAVHAFERAARAEVAEEFAGTCLPATLQVVRGDVSDGILNAAAALTDAVVIIGASRAESFQQLILGSTATRLAQELAQPLLVVRRRTRGRYARIVVANDFGDAARRALGTAVGLFPAHRITLMHVLEDSARGIAEASRGAVHTAFEKSERFLDQCALPAGAHARIDIVIGHGNVAEAVSRHVEATGTQLVVLGVHPRSALARVFVGSISDELLRRLPCDTLLVRATEGGAYA